MSSRSPDIYLFFTGIPYERALHSLHGVLCARSRPTAQLSSAQCTQLQITSAVGFSPSAQMQQTASIPTAHHSPFGLCLLLVLLLLAVATYSDYFTLTSVHVCLSCSSGVLYRSSNADYAGESSPSPDISPLGKMSSRSRRCHPAYGAMSSRSA